MSISSPKFLIITFFGLLCAHAYSAREINTIKVGKTTYTFFDTDSFYKFKESYADSKCEDNITNPINCECHRLKLNGMLNAQISKKKTRMLDKRIKKIKHFMQKAQNIEGRKIKGKRCQNFRSYSLSECKSKNRRSSCACLSVWYQKQIDYLERKVDSDVEKILGDKIKSIDPSKVILTNLKFLEQCQIAPLHVTSKVPCNDPVPQKVITPIKKECTPSNLPLPEKFQIAQELTTKDIAKIDQIKKSNQNLDSKNLSNFLCQSNPIQQNGSIHSEYVPRAYSDIIELSKSLPPKEKNIVQSLAKHPCFQSNAQSLQYCKHFNLSCQSLRSSSTEKLQKRILSFAKRNCLQAFCEGHVTTNSESSSEMNELFSNVLKGTNFTDITEYCQDSMSRYPGKGYPLQRNDCDGFNAPSRGIVKGQKCTPGVDQQFATFYEFANGVATPTTKKHKECQIVAPSCFKEFDEDFFYCNLTPNTQLTKKCKRSAKKHKSLEWAKHFDDASIDFTAFVEYLHRLTDLEKHKISFLNKDKLAEYYPLNGQGYGVNVCLDGTLSENIAPIYSELVTSIATGPVKLIDYTVRGARAISEYIENVNDDIKDHYQPTQLDLSVAITKFHQCMTKSCETQDQIVCFDTIKEFDRKQFLYQRYNSDKCKISKGIQRTAEFAEATGKASKVISKAGLISRIGRVADTIKPDKLSGIIEDTECTDNQLNEVFNIIAETPANYYELTKLEKLKGLSMVCENYQAHNAHTDQASIETSKDILNTFCGN